MTTDDQEFVVREKTAVSSALEAHHWPVSLEVGMAQVVVETGWGTSYAWRSMANPAGIESDGRLRQFPTPEAGIDAWATLLETSPLYVRVREAKGDNIAQAHALGESPWSASHYGSPPGQDIINLLPEIGPLLSDVSHPMPDPTPTPNPTADKPAGEVGTGMKILATIPLEGGRFQAKLDGEPVLASILLGSAEGCGNHVPPRFEHSGQYHLEIGEFSEYIEADADSTDDTVYLGALFLVHKGLSFKTDGQDAVFSEAKA